MIVPGDYILDEKVDDEDEKEEVVELLSANRAIKDGSFMHNVK